MTFPPNKEDYKIKIYGETDKLDKIIDESIKTFSSSITIYKDNKKILDICNKNDDILIETLSVTKSFCALAIMFLIQDGLIKSVEDLVCIYVKCWGYGKKKDIKIKHILSHTSGLDKYWSYENFMMPEGSLDYFLSDKKFKRPNVAEIVMTTDKVGENESGWYYNDTAVQIIPVLVKNITGIQIDKYLNKKLFKPLGIKYKWNKDDDGNSYGPNGLSISSDGLCKVGLLIMNNGMLGKKKILDNELIKQMTRIRTSQKEMRKCPIFSKTNFSGYGYLWYRYNDLIIAEGFLGQILIIDKKRKIVASRLLQTKWGNKKFEKEINKDKIYFGIFKDLI
tara:strand:- start:1585 stop:2592 length:1008 start_codon:yes stop_codon:yes gene_type:complete